jgi:hypothetical protein
MSNEYTQTIATEAARLATQAAMNGHPSIVVWIPPKNGTDRPHGNFAVVDYPPKTGGSFNDPWNTKGL